MSFQHLRLLLIVGWVMLGGAGCATVPVTVSNPIPGLTTVAVAPFFNLSSEPTVDGRRFALAYFSELQKMPGFQVIPVGVVEQAIRENRLSMDSPADAVALCQILEADAVVVGAVTDYSPYYPPRVGLQIDWYSHKDWVFFPGVSPGDGPGGASPPGEMPAQGTRPEGPGKPLFLWGHSSRSKDEPVRQEIRQATSTGAVVRGQSPIDGAGSFGAGSFGAGADESPPGYEDRFADLRQADLGPRPYASQNGPFVLAQATSKGAKGLNPTIPQPTWPTRSRSSLQAPSPRAATGMPAPVPGELFDRGPQFPVEDGAPDRRPGELGLPVPGVPEPRLLDEGPAVRERQRPVRPPKPLMSYTRNFLGTDPKLVEALQNHVQYRGDLRSGGWEAYLQRSEDFIRFTSHLMIVEMLAVHGGTVQTEMVFKWWK